MCSNSSKALAPAFKQNVISELSYAHPLLCREMFIPREQQQNPGCQDEMKWNTPQDTLRNVDARSEGDTAGTMTVGEREGSVTRSYRKWRTKRDFWRVQVMWVLRGKGKAGRKSSASRSMPSRRWNQRSSSTKLFSPLSSSNLRREKEREREREREVEAIYFITHICYTSFTAPMHHQLAISACTLTRGRPPPPPPLRRWLVSLVSCAEDRAPCLVHHTLQGMPFWKNPPFFDEGVQRSHHTGPSRRPCLCHLDAAHGAVDTFWANQSPAQSGWTVIQTLASVANHSTHPGQRAYLWRVWRQRVWRQENNLCPPGADERHGHWGPVLIYVVEYQHWIWLCHRIIPQARAQIVPHPCYEGLTVYCFLRDITCRHDKPLHIARSQ